ncbi:Sodium hydrogen exchanger 7 [Micractinium conductrix]|uniref:Sodium hydrogen exchanger 7 n=1 Tax=Micractinium conductrix TaxID=554055 RepID=A0A2P6V434_9CHLO|nr:Sodium hydrogen exchanger 7 [Micractinium conductrix]|eukprot:PSC68844.1 Sodium hydrogen exchanger 7 [Micractinium conductrix]
MTPTSADAGGDGSVSAQANLTEALAAVLQSQWTPDAYTSYYDIGWCLNQNVSYSHRVNAEDNFNYCSVPLSGSDAFLFAALALLVASVCMGKLQSVWVLIVGGCLGILNYEVNLNRLGNAISLWLGMQPPDLFFYAFLPPLLVDAALRIDWYRFTKLWPHIILMAYGMVLINAAVLAPFILFVLGFSSRGWDWIHGAVLAAMLAPTDAVAVSAILKAGGGPEGMVVLMEGEALLNDASAVTLYTVFLHILKEASVTNVMPSVPSQIWPIIKEILRLTGIGVGVGLAFAWALGYVLRLLRWRGVRPYIESLVVLATAYLTFYIAQSPAKGSGVIAVCVYGLYGAATGHWGMLATDAESGIHEAVWDTVAFAANALVFFWSGISSVNFVARSAGQLSKNAWNYAAIPIIFLFMYAFRGACMIAFMPIFKLFGTKVSLPDTAFATVAGLRGSLTLIMAADFIIHSDFYSGGPVAEANFDVVLWASAFVLLSLLINAPLIGPVMRWTGLSRISPDKVRGRKKALEELQAFTAQSIDDLKQQQDGEFLQGANWSLVATFVDHTRRLKGFVPRPLGAKKVAAGGDDATATAAAAAAAAAAGAAAKPLGGLAPGQAPALGSLGARKASCRSFLDDGAAEEDDYEVPFLPGHGGAAAAPKVENSVLSVAALQAAARGGGGGSLRGSFYDASAADVAAAAAGTAAATAVQRALGGRRGSAADASVGAPPTGGASTVQEGEEEEEVELLFSQGDDASGGGDFDTKWQQSLQAAPVAGTAAAAGAGAAGGAAAAAEAQRALAASAGAAASKAAAAMVRRQISSVAASRAAAAGAGSQRDLLGRLQLAEPAAAVPITAAATPSPSPAERRRDAPAADLEAAVPEVGESPKAGSASEAGDEVSSMQELRLRVLNGIKRHFRAQRMAGLLSPAGLRVAIYACDKAIEHAEEHPADQLCLWDALEKEIRGSWTTRAVASLLASTLRLHRRAFSWWRRLSSVPFRLFTGILRKHLGSKMLVACEAAVELYMGLAASPQIQWVYFSEDTPVALLREVQQQLLGAYAFIQEKEAEAPAQYRAVQSYRAAMAVLRQQRAFAADLYERGAVDEDEREALNEAVDAAMRHLDMTGPIWRPPAPDQVLRSLDVFSGAPRELVDWLLAQAQLEEYRPGQAVWSSRRAASDENGAAPGLYVVLLGVVREEYTPVEGAAAAQLRGAGAMFGELSALCGACLPGSEAVVACGNSFGRGPLLCRLPEASLDGLRSRAAAGDAPAAALETELLRVAAMHALQHMQGDVQQVVGSSLGQHRPLAKYSAGAGAAAPAANGHQTERAARYTAQVLLDLLQGIPSASLLRMQPGDSYRHASHAVVLQGALEPAAGGEPLAAPAVLPHITSHRFSFAAAKAVAEQRPVWKAGRDGAVLLVCSTA